MNWFFYNRKNILDVHYILKRYKSKMIRFWAVNRDKSIFVLTITFFGPTFSLGLSKESKMSPAFDSYSKASKLWLGIFKILIVRPLLY
jgi:hypothetical protein